MAEAALSVRKKLALALDRGIEGIGDFEAASRLSPGSLPFGDFRRHEVTLDAYCSVMPENLTAQFALAEARARNRLNENERFVSIIRRNRPIDNFAACNIDTAIFAPPSIRRLVWHSIDTGREFVEGQRKTSRVLASEMLKAQFPDFKGKSVLDIGAFCGWFSFEAERRGAASVTATDFYSWVLDFPKIQQWVASEAKAGRMTNAYDPPEDCYDVDGMPGRIAFDLSRHAFDSKVRPVIGRFEDTEFEPHDIVLLLGVLYHQENPYWMLKKVAALTKETLVLETLGIHAPGHEGTPLWEFYGSGQTRNDGSTFWAPNEQGLIDMLKRVGFKHVEVKHGEETVMDAAPQGIAQCRLWVHAHK